MPSGINTGSSPGTRSGRRRTAAFLGLMVLTGFLTFASPGPAHATEMLATPKLECTQGTGTGGTVAVRAYPYSPNYGTEAMSYSMELWQWTKAAGWKKSSTRTGWLYSGPIAGAFGTRAIWGNVYPYGVETYYAVNFAMWWYENGTMKQWGPSFVTTHSGYSSCWIF